MSLHPRSDAFFGVAVGGSRIDVIYSKVDYCLKYLVCEALRASSKARGAKDYSSAIVSCVAEGMFGDHGFTLTQFKDEVLCMELFISFT